VRAGKYADAAVPAAPTALVAPVVPAAAVGGELDRTRRMLPGRVL
jgi:hypothetical protein